MKIESLIKRKDGTLVDMDAPKRRYHFKPEDGQHESPHVAEVDVQGHANALLRIREGFRLIEGEDVAAAAARALSLDHSKTLTGSNVHNATYTLSGGIGVRTGALRLDICSGLADAIALSGTGVAITGLRRIRTSGNQFVQSNGVAIRLKSINWFGAEGENYTPHGTWGRSWRGIIDQIKQLGFNCIRLPFSGYMATSNPVPPSSVISASANPDLLGLTALQIFDKIIDYCLASEIYVVLDHHRRTAGVGADGSPVGTGYTLAKWKSSWAIMANRYRDKINVVGADVHNEPHDLNWATWAGYVEECGNQIHTIAPDWIIFCEGVGSDASGAFWWGGALGGVATRPVVLTRSGRLAYSPHEYGQSVGVQSWLAYDGQTAPAGWPNNLYAVWRAHWGFIFEQNIAPIWVGEFGGKYGLDGTGAVNPTLSPHGDLEKQWTANLCKYLNGDFTGDGSNDLSAGKLGISFAYWALNPNSGDTGGMLKDDWQTVQTVKRNLLNTILAG
ncbi:glycoside hydrolase family 5 protein [Rhizobium aegyptiacum]|uniref:glycoside hydrolase family 5 protein n=2 Tax=Rhizobium TaxID=379 RepID=UPI0007E5B899|nr:glycoside hydrolase family 5 protein [Rhizobium aegyptiacum]